jgi:hypothetical protein
VRDRRSDRGRASGLDLVRLGTTGAAIVYFADRRVTRLEMYFNRDRAFADLGLGLEESAP